MEEYRVNRPEPSRPVAEKEVRKEKVDLNGDPEKLAKQWLDMVRPRPAPEPIPDFDEEEVQ